MAKLVLTGGSDGDFEFEVVPEGFFTARCYRIIDLGTQPVTFEGDTKYKHQLMFGWEIIGKDDPRMKDGRPFSVHKTYTASLNEKSNLAKDLKTWRGKSLTEEEELGFDIFSMLGEFCQLQVLHTQKGDRTYANIGALVPFTGEKPEAENETLEFVITEPDLDVFNKLSDRLKEKIESAPEWKGAQSKAKDTVVDVDADKDITIEDLDSGDPIDPKDIPF
jgi:hypothetical protein